MTLLREAIREKLVGLKFTPSQATAAARGWFVNQFDYTRDIRGFFYSYNYRADFIAIKELLGARFARVTNAKNVSSFPSCFQYLVYDDAGMMQRFKVYNKVLNLL